MFEFCYQPKIVQNLLEQLIPIKINSNYRDILKID